MEAQAQKQEEEQIIRDATQTNLDRISPQPLTSMALLVAFLKSQANVLFASGFTMCLRTFFPQAIESAWSGFNWSFRWDDENKHLLKDPKNVRPQ